MLPCFCPPFTPISSRYSSESVSKEFVNRGFKLNDYDENVLVKAFTSLSLQDLHSSSLVCKKWNQIASSDQIWESICSSRPELVDDFLPLIKNGLCKWKDVYRYAPLVSLLNQSFQTRFSNSWVLNQNSLRSPSYMPQAFIRHGKFRFGIVENSKIKIFNPQSQVLGVLHNDNDRTISRLRAEGDYLFSINQQGLISQWDFKEQKLVQEIETRSMKKEPRSSIVCKFPVLSICDFHIQDGYIVIKYSGMDPSIEVIPYNEQDKKSIFEIQKVLLCRFYILSVVQGKLYIANIQDVQGRVSNTEIIVIDLQKNGEITRNTIQSSKTGSPTKFSITKNNIFVDLSKSFQNRSRIDVYDRISCQKIKQIVFPETLHYEKLVAIGHLLFCFQLSKGGRIVIIDTHFGKEIGSVEKLFNSTAKDLNPTALGDLVTICKEQKLIMSSEHENTCIIDSISDLFKTGLHI